MIYLTKDDVGIYTLWNCAGRRKPKKDKHGYWQCKGSKGSEIGRGTFKELEFPSFIIDPDIDNEGVYSVPDQMLQVISHGIL